ncbi:uncharacterized protein EI97DRAFT_454317 [Westerdykella ornata]|uniref:Uncharacterized protein n=1 Tax=Westerdykella ornata TaxID=318751 RepID=A0A6A6K168_WESOR|nr:uncharacterized protein EI97DRAFT_454317 [Westerdykella ornata]KAF2281099.1 hypothetical protein EI97DRAFT_454317 [Westerdykella ornata]
MSANNDIFRIRFDAAGDTQISGEQLVELGLFMDHDGSLYTLEDWNNPEGRIPLMEQDLRVRRLVIFYNKVEGSLCIDEHVAKETTSVVEMLEEESNKTAACWIDAERRLKKKAEVTIKTMEHHQAETDRKLQIALAEIDAMKARRAEERIQELEQALSELKLSVDRTIEEKDQAIEQIRVQAGMFRERLRSAEASQDHVNQGLRTSRRRRYCRRNHALANLQETSTHIGDQVSLGDEREIASRNSADALVEDDGQVMF